MAMVKVPVLGSVFLTVCFLLVSVTTSTHAVRDRLSLPQSTLARIESGSALFDRVWTLSDGLGPLINAQSCAACHAHPTRGGSTARRDDFVLLSPEVADPTGGHVFARFDVTPDGPTRLRTLPRASSLRRAPPLFGLGLLEQALVPEESSPPGSQRTGFGRFGVKARFHSIRDAVVAAFANELGLLTTATAGGRRVEVSEDDVRLVTDFVRSLPPLAPTASVPEGRKVFERIGCGTCHVPTLKISGSAQVTIAPYSDLRLHDMGKVLSEPWDDGIARGAEFRTTPLWGLSRTGPPYLHDGRAATVEAAIEFHGGEAESYLVAYRLLSPSDRQQLLRFLKSL